MKNNKGFAPVAVIIVIIIVLAVGGLVYYMGKNSNSFSQTAKDNNYQPQKNQNGNNNTPPGLNPATLANAVIRSITATTRSEAKVYFEQQKGSYKNVCQTASFEKDINDLKTQGNAETVTCYDSVESYAISATSPYPSGSSSGFICADSLGFAGLIKSNITGPKCQ